MKRIKHLSMAAVMTLILAFTTPAGEIHTGVLPPPPPPPPTESAVSDFHESTSTLSSSQSDLVPSTLDAEILLIFLQMFSVY